MKETEDNRKDICMITDYLQFIPLSRGYRIEDFSCEIEEYSAYLKENALEYHNARISKAHLLVNKQNGDIVAYMVLITDSIRLSEKEKEDANISHIPFGAFPALKIGKLAVHEAYKKQYKGIGSLMIEISRGVVNDINEAGVACKYITIDADVEHNPTVDLFYKKNGFKENETRKKQTHTISMRLDVFNDSIEKQEQLTGTDN